MCAGVCVCVCVYLCVCVSVYVCMCAFDLYRHLLTLLSGERPVGLSYIALRHVTETMKCGMWPGSNASGSWSKDLSL